MSVTLLPEKHVRTSESLLGLGALVLVSLATEPKNLETLWADMKELDPVKRRVHGSITLDSVVLAVDFLFAVGAVTLNREGLLEHASH
jgi:hypothetical protein